MSLPVSTDFIFDKPLFLFRLNLLRRDGGHCKNMAYQRPAFVKIQLEHRLVHVLG